jgi:hypothetical protein
MSLLDAELRGTHLVEASAGTAKRTRSPRCSCVFLLERELGVDRSWW